jgi:hypothetical protein
MHPVYISSAHIHTAVRNQPSQHAFILVAYIPVCKFTKTHFSTAKLRQTMPGRLQARLFHYCMSLIFDTVAKAGRESVSMTDCYGNIRHMLIHPVIYIADREEHLLNVCVTQSECISGTTQLNDFGTFEPCHHRTCKWETAAIPSADSSCTAHTIMNKIRAVRQANPHATTEQFVMECHQVIIHLGLFWR